MRTVDGLKVRMKQIEAALNAHAVENERVHCSLYLSGRSKPPIYYYLLPVPNRNAHRIPLCVASFTVAL